MRRVQRVAVAVVLAATLAGGGVAVADDGTARAAGSGLGRIAYADGALTLDPADGAHVIKVGRAGVADASAPGWDTTGVPEGVVAGDTVRWSLTGLDGPGDLKVYSDVGEQEHGGAGDALLFDSADDVRDVRELPVGQVGGTRWEFSEDGTYRVIFTAEATAADGREMSIGTVYTVVVGDTAGEEDSGAEEPAADETPAEESPENGQTPHSPAVAGKVVTEAAEAERRTALAATAASTDVVSDTKVLDEGHVDFAARVVDNKLQIHIKDGTVSGKTTWREPSSVVLHVKPAAKNTLPAGDEFAFLGKGGDPVWLLDQVQQEGLLWPGWSTDNIKAGATKGGVEFSLTEVEGPGTYALYTYDAMSGANVLFNSKDGVPDSVDVPANTHAHGGWAFTKEGTYRLTFKMSGTLASGTKVSDTETVTFVVGDTDPGTVTPGDGSGKGTSAAAGSAGTSGSSDTSGSASGSGSTGGSGGDGSMASTGAGQAVLLGSAAAALTAVGAVSFLAARRRRTAHG